MKMKLAFILLLFVVLFSCNKDANNFQNVFATVVYEGDITADGCGWLIKNDATSTTYKPGMLPASFQKDQLKVIISYRLLTTKYQCGQLVIGGPFTSSGNGIPEIAIITIAKR